MTIAASQIALLVPPSAALLYSIAVQCFLAGWHECPWTSQASSISIRLAVLVVAIAIALALDDNGNDNDTVQLTSFLPSAIISSMVSTLLIMRTRRIYVSGPKPTAAVVTENARDKVIMITGSNTGIGKETARQLLAAGATVIMACRSESRAREAMEDILSSMDKKQKQKQALANANEDACVNTTESSNLVKSSNSKTTKIATKSPRDRLLFLQCDVSDYSSVRRSVKTFHGMKLPLHVLINNAGIMMGTRKENASEHGGHELMMSANHLGHFLLTNLLLPTLQENNGRVVVVTSSTYALATEGIDLDDLNCERRRYTMFSQYAQSKLANILMGKELDRREKERIRVKMEKNENDFNISDMNKIKPVKVYIVHPGLVRTDVVRNMPWYLRYPNMLVAFILITLQKAPEAGAYTNVFCATSDKVEDQSGEYFSNSQIVETNEFSKDAEKAKALWDLSCEMVGLVADQDGGGGGVNNGDK